MCSKVMLLPFDLRKHPRSHKDTLREVATRG
uniref:Uncharacterized protein n=1 Tax=Setaria italica TaxID=4555 RepID=K3YEZ1_SETIT